MGLHISRHADLPRSAQRAILERVAGRWRIRLWRAAFGGTPLLGPLWSDGELRTEEARP
jgi:hypothetical protein